MSREVPSGWNSVELNDLTLTPDGLQTGPFGSQLKASEYTGSGIPVVMPSDIVNGKINVRNIARVPEATANRLEAHKLMAGDIVFARRGDIGRCSIVRQEQAGYLCGTGCLRARLNPALITAAFADHLFKSAPVVEWLNGHAVGQTMLNLNTAIISKIPLRLPPLHEQRRIAEILSSVDEAIEATRAVIEQTRKVKQGVLERLLSKGIGHTRFKQTEIGEIPEGWAVRRLADLAEDSRNSFVIGPFGSDLTVKDYCDEGVPVVFVRDVQSDRFRWKSEVYVSPEKAERLRAHSARPGDIVITKMGLPPGIAAEIPPSFENSIVTADIVRLRPNTKIASSAFLAIALNGERVADAVAEITGGQTRPKITLRDYKSISLALPPIEEQRDIVANVEPFKTLIEQEASKLDRLLTIKSALMSDLLTGRKRVTDALPMAAE
ncbi:restriction endonuclease subunit S [Rhizobium wuzhouense]|uniref:Type I restriction modification DNA specificity domain-containing protein n=1 Tax=Rhizobium wuzhouense TaxID=1986026 RepID=A0ABX5NWM3_9HYPH|nr:restriction endonuclease subunit S [Rhizobium wuzhouense]PYB77582.1 hypothetical protein DMY87_04315 [Rhizobium wuzhouense]